MTYDLHRDLPELGAHARVAVPDLPVEDLVHQLQRRRTVRATLRTAGALVVVGGMVAGGVALADVRRPAPPAETPTDFSSCGRTPEELGWVQNGPLVVGFMGIQVNDMGSLSGDAYVESTDEHAQQTGPGDKETIVALRDGVVAGVLDPADEPVTSPEPFPTIGTLRSCASPDAPLEAGAYELLATAPVTYYADGWFNSEVAPLTGTAVGREGVVIVDGSAVEDRALHAFRSEGRLPVCGSERDPTSWSRPGETGLRIDVDVPAEIAGSAVPTTVLTVALLNRAPAGVATRLLETPPTYVLVHDGVVVSHPSFIPIQADVEFAPLTAQAFQYGSPLLWGCGLPAGAEQGTVPAGAYELWVAVPVAQGGQEYWATAGPWAFTVGEGGPTLAGAGVPTDVPLAYETLLGATGGGPDGPWRVDVRLGLAGVSIAIESFQSAGWEVVAADLEPDATGHHRAHFTNGTWDVVLDATGGYYDAIGWFQITRS